MIETQNKAIDEAVQRFVQEGYQTAISPNTSELPSPLRHFHPDVIATRPGRNVFFELRLPAGRRVRRVDYWRELSEAIQKLPGWHLELQNISQEPQYVEVAGKQEIQALQNESHLLLKQGLNNAALLVAWAALEAAARHSQKRFTFQEANGKLLAPSQVVRQLYENGLLDRPDYEFLIDMSRQRNAAAHGFQYSVQGTDLYRVVAIIETLLSE